MRGFAEGETTAAIAFTIERDEARLRRRAVSTEPSANRKRLRSVDRTGLVAESTFSRLHAVAINDSGQILCDTSTGSRNEHAVLLSLK